MHAIQTFSQADFPTALKWQAIAFMRVEWPFVFQGEGRLISEPYPPSLNPVHVAATEGDVLLSYASLLPLTLEHAGESFRVDGFGNLFTFPPYRREGLGSGVLARAMEAIRAGGADLSILFCDPANEGFYRRAGWETLPSPTFVGDHRHEANTMALFVTEKGRAARAAFRDQPLRIEEAW